MGGGVSKDKELLTHFANYAGQQKSEASLTYLNQNLFIDPQTVDEKSGLSYFDPIQFKPDENNTPLVQDGRREFNHHLFEGFCFDFKDEAASKVDMAVEKLCAAANLRLKQYQRENQLAKRKISAADLANITFETVTSVFVHFPRQQKVAKHLESILKNILSLGDGTSLAERKILILNAGLPRGSRLRNEDDPVRFYPPLLCHVLSLGAGSLSDEIRRDCRDQSCIKPQPDHSQECFFAAVQTVLNHQTFCSQKWPAEPYSFAVDEPQELILGGPTTLEENHGARSPLHLIANLEYSDATATAILRDMLMSGKFHPQDKALSNDESCLDHRKMSPLMYAVRSHKLELIKEFIARKIGGCDSTLASGVLGKQSNLGFALYLACGKQQFSDKRVLESVNLQREIMRNIVSLLLSCPHSDAPNLKDEAINLAVESSNFGAFEALLNSGARIVGEKAQKMAAATQNARGQVKSSTEYH
jgi:hypothetical protein